MTESAHAVAENTSGQWFSCREDESILAGMMRHSMQLIPIGCCNGGCGVCKIQVHSGAYTAKKMSRQQVSETEERRGVVLACRAFPRSGLVFEKFCRASEGAHFRQTTIDNGVPK